MILVHFDYERSVIIDANTSEKAMRAWLQQIKYLEHIIIIKKLKMNSEKIKTIIEFLTSEYVKNIQAFQKLAKYY